MKISIEATPLFQNKNIPRAGIAQYIYQATTRMIDEHKEDSFTLFANKFGGGTLGPGLTPGNAKQRVVKYIPGKIWNVAARKNIMPPIETFMPRNQDVYWFTNFRTYSTLRHRRRVTTIYDAAFIKYPEYIQKKNLAYLRDQVPRSLRVADKIITISESAKTDLVSLLDADPNKIIVAPCGVDKDFLKPANNKSVLKKYNIKGKYLLFIGTIEPRKNLVNLIKAYDMLPASYREEYSLVLAGGRGWNDGEIQSEINKKRSAGRLILTGYVADEDIAALYTHATVFLYPSFYEGFGLPILEALACGTAVLTAKNSSLEEVAQNAAYYVDEFSIESISTGIQKLIDSESLRRNIVKFGKARVAAYPWSKTSEIIYRTLASE